MSDKIRVLVEDGELNFNEREGEIVTSDEKGVLVRYKRKDKIQKYFLIPGNTKVAKLDGDMMVLVRKDNFYAMYFDDARYIESPKPQEVMEAFISANIGREMLITLKEMQGGFKFKWWYLLVAAAVGLVAFYFISQGKGGPVVPPNVPVSEGLRWLILYI